jgi:hypothetical protein
MKGTVVTVGTQIRRPRDHLPFESPRCMFPSAGSENGNTGENAALIAVGLPSPLRFGGKS